MSELKLGFEHQKMRSHNTLMTEKFCVGRLAKPEHGVYVERPEIAAILEHIAGGGENVCRSTASTRKIISS